MFKRILSLTVIVCFFLTTLGPMPCAHGSTTLTTGAESVLGLPTPGTMVNLSPAYQPVIIKGLTVHKDNPFLFDFIVDVGQDRISGQPLKKEGEKLIKYFLASLAIPDKDLWVNLSPYEKNRMIPEVLGQTDMGRDLLEQDYILKQITASLIYPEKQLGKSFWDKVYAKAQAMYGTTQVPVNTFNKVWIMADKAEVFEHNQTAFVVDCHLKVMLEEDYLALSHRGSSQLAAGSSKEKSKPATFDLRAASSLSSQIVKQIILPQLEREVNIGKNFANLRQIFNSIILSSWYKKNLKEALLNQVYADKSKVKGINLNDPTLKQQIYEQYLKAYKKGVFNYIKEDVNNAGQTMPRKYFSGGTVPGAALDPAMTHDPAMLENSIRGEELVDFATLTFTHATNSDLAMTAENPPFVTEAIKRLASIVGQYKAVLNENEKDEILGLIKKIEDNYLLENITEIIRQINEKLLRKNVPVLSERDQFLVRYILNALRALAGIKDILHPENKQEKVRFGEYLDIKRIIFFDEDNKGTNYFYAPRINDDFPVKNNADLNFLQSLLVVRYLSNTIYQYKRAPLVGYSERFYPLLWSIAESYHLISRPAPTSDINAAMSTEEVIAELKELDHYSSLFFDEHIANVVRDFLNDKIDEETAVGQIGYPDKSFIEDLLNLARSWRDGTPYINPKFSLISGNKEELDTAMTAKEKKIDKVIIPEVLTKFGLEKSKTAAIRWVLLGLIDNKFEFRQLMTDLPDKTKVDDIYNYLLQIQENLEKTAKTGHEADAAMGAGMGTASGFAAVMLLWHLSLNPQDTEVWQAPNTLTWDLPKHMEIPAQEKSKNVPKTHSLRLEQWGPITFYEGNQAFVQVMVQEKTNVGNLMDSLRNQGIHYMILILGNETYSMSSRDLHDDWDKIPIPPSTLVTIRFPVFKKYPYEPIIRAIINPAMLSTVGIGIPQRADAASLAYKPGGIDLNTQKGMQWKVSKDGKGIEMNVDPAMIERIRREGIDSLSPVIFKITPVANIWSLVGLQAPVAR